MSRVTGAEGAVRPSYLPDVLEEHLDELGFLWGVRQADLRSPDEPFRSFLETEERVQAHLQGILVVGEKAGGRLAAGLEAEDPLEVFAAALPLLHLGADRAGRVVEAFGSAGPDARAGLRMALAHGPLGDGGAGAVRDLLDSAEAPRAAAAAEVLAFHGALEADDERLGRWRGAEEAPVRRVAWRVTALVGQRVEPRAYAEGARDEDPESRAAALEAAAWAGEPGVVRVGRSIAAEPAPEHLPVLRLLAVLGGPEERSLFRTIAEAEALGPDRFGLLASYGDPTLVPLVVRGCGSEDPLVAAAAGRAFAKLTGVDVTSQEVVEVSNADGGEDEMDAEFTDPVALPDAGRAAEAWDSLRPRLERAPRIGLGRDLEQGIGRERLLEMDMQARWELFLRARHAGRWKGSPLQLEVLPQGR